VQCHPEALSSTHWILDAFITWCRTRFAVQHCRLSQSPSDCRTRGTKKKNKLAECFAEPPLHPVVF
jgi:hypothetical protein